MFYTLQMKIRNNHWSWKRQHIPLKAKQGSNCHILPTCAQHTSEIWLGPTSLCGEGNGTPLQYSCLENPMDGGAWWTAVHGVARSLTERLHFHFSLLCIGEGNGNPLQCSCLKNPRDGGLTSLGSHRVGHDWSDLEQQLRIDCWRIDAFELRWKTLESPLDCKETSQFFTSCNCFCCCF